MKNRKNKRGSKKEQELKTQAILKVIIGLREDKGLTFKKIGEKFGSTTRYVAKIYRRATRERDDKSHFAGLDTRTRNCFRNLGIRDGENTIRDGENTITEILHIVKRGRIIRTRNFGEKGYQKLRAWLLEKGITIPDQPPYTEESEGDAQAAKEYFDKRDDEDVAVIVEAIAGDNISREDLPTIIDDICKGQDRSSIMLIAKRMTKITETLEVIIDNIELEDGRQIKKDFPYDYGYERSNTKHKGLLRSTDWHSGKNRVDWYEIRCMQAEKDKMMKELEDGGTMRNK